jgi:hypothetical protein
VELVEGAVPIHLAEDRHLPIMTPIPAKVTAIEQRSGQYQVIVQISRKYRDHLIPWPLGRNIIGVVSAFFLRRLNSTPSL